MTVLARNRQQAPTEFEMNCARLVKYTVNRADHVPNRYKKFIRPRLCKLVNLAYYNAIMANEADARTQTGRKERAKLFLPVRMKYRVTVVEKENCGKIKVTSS